MDNENINDQDDSTEVVQDTEKAAKHTPGPWRAAVEMNGSQKIASVMKGTDMLGGHNVFTNISSNEPITGQEPVANAALMAAAPEMEKCLKDARKAIASLNKGALGWAHTEQGEPMYPYRDELLHNIDKALAKAHGKE